MLKELLKTLLISIILLVPYYNFKSATSSGVSYQITGQVLDSEIKEPLIGAIYR